MLIKINIFILTLFIGATSFIAVVPEHPTSIKWLVVKGGDVKVDGSTNVNRFSCKVSGYLNTDTITCNKKKATDIAVVMDGKLNIPVAGFDCVNRMMTKDLRKTLKAADFPVLIIHFISLEKYPEMKQSEEHLNGIVDIELAGATKRVAVSFTVSINSLQVAHLTGTQQIHFSDFNLARPKKFGGMVKADNKLDVTFNMDFKVVAG